MRLVLQVRDLDRAVAFLRAQDLLGEADDERAIIAPARLGSLQIHLVSPRG